MFRKGDRQGKVENGQSLQYGREIIKLNVANFVYFKLSKRKLG